MCGLQICQNWHQVLENPSLNSSWSFKKNLHLMKQWWFAFQIRTIALMRQMRLN